MIYVSATLTNKLKIFLETVYEKNICFILTNDSHHNLANIRHNFIPVLS